MFLIGTLLSSVLRMDGYVVENKQLHPPLLSQDQEVFLGKTVSYELLVWGGQCASTRVLPNTSCALTLRSAAREDGDQILRTVSVRVWMMPPAVSLTLVCAVLCVSTCVALCPPRCECSQSQHTVRCASAALFRIPAAIPSDTSSLIITGNTIPRLDHSSFNGLQNVTHLNLSNNG